MGQMKFIAAVIYFPTYLLLRRASLFVVHYTFTE